MSYDIVIIGSGAGGGTLAWALRDCGARILIIERGDFLPQEDRNWSPEAVFPGAAYKPQETWQDAHSGQRFVPGVHYFVGGNTKVFGAALPRFRKEDFSALEHEDGTSPAWPVSYEEMEPYYVRAENLYRVHGDPNEDPTEPPRSTGYLFGPVPHEPEIESLAGALCAEGLHPFHLPMGIDLRPGGRCIRCHTCDGFPCKVLAKSDAEVCCVRPALESPSVSILTGATALRLCRRENRVHAVEVQHGGTKHTIQSGTFVVACGAVNSAALLLNSEPGGLANSSGLVGRHYMVHNNTAMCAVRMRKNRTVFQKTLAINDYYFGGPDWPWPMGNLQIIGKVQAPMLKTARPRIPIGALNAIANRSMDWWVMSEDLPHPDNQVTVTASGRIRVHWKPNNMATHRRLIQECSGLMRRIGYRLVFTETMGIATNSHQCGTLRFGTDPGNSVLNPNCRSHDVPNLYVIDSSFFPSSAAMNPALTIAAMALRTADHLKASL